MKYKYKNKYFIYALIVFFLLLFAISLYKGIQYSYIFLILAILLIPTKQSIYEIPKIIICILLFLLRSHIAYTPINTEGIKVTFLNVEHGDASVIDLENHHAIMVDVGSKEYADRVIKYLNDNQIYTIDKIYLTHPHEDHVGSLKVVGESADIKEVYVPKNPSRICK